MSLLSKLPLELLDIIIEIVVLTERAPPIHIGTADRDRYNVEDGQARVGILKCWSIANVLHERRQQQANAGGLLLTSRWLQGRTKDAIARIYPDGVRYKLDVMLVNEHEMWASWLHVPVVAKRVQRVDVQLRIFGPHQGSSRRSIFARGDGGPSQIHWTLYYILERFLRLGLAQIPRLVPDEYLRSKTLKNLSFAKDLEMVVDQIAIDVSTGDIEHETYGDTPEHMDRWRTTYSHWRLDDNEDNEERPPLQMHPKWLAGIVDSAIGSLVDMSYHTSSYGQVVYDRVGTFLVTCNGVEPKLFELGGRLARMSAVPEPPSDWYNKYTFGHLPGDCRLLSFWNWKYATVQNRASRGLEVPAELDWPTYETFMRWREAVANERSQQTPMTFPYGCDRKRCCCESRDLEAMLKASGQV